MLRTKSADPTSHSRRILTAVSNGRSCLKSSSALKRSHIGRENISQVGYELIPTIQQRLQIQPPTAIFEEFECNKIYQIELNLLNLSANTIKYKLMPPSTKYFRITNHQQFNSIASGLSTKFTVSFRATDHSMDYFDEIIIHQSDARHVILLKARSCRPHLTFSGPTGMNFLRRNQFREFKIDISNTGSHGVVQFRKQPYSQYTICPESLQIGKGESRQLRVIVQPRQAGIQRHSIQVIVNNTVIEETIDIVYSVFDHSQYILNNQGLKCKEISFGKLYYGQKRQLKCKLYNNTPNIEELNIKMVMGNLIQSGEKLTRNQSPQQIGNQQTSRILRVLPSKATVKPFEQLELTLFCQPEIKQQQIIKVARYAHSNVKNPLPGSNNPKVNNVINKYRINQQPFDYTLVVSFSERESTPIYCTVGGSCLLPAIKLSEPELNFGRMICGTSQTKMLLISNCNNEFPVDVLIRRVNGVQCQPSRKVIAPCSEDIFQITINPIVLGNFSKNVEIILEGLFTINLGVKGQVIAPSVIRTQLSQNTCLSEIDITQTLQLQNRIKNNNNFNRLLTANRKSRNHAKQMKKQDIFTSMYITNNKKNTTFRGDDSLPLDFYFDYKINPTCNEQTLELPSDKDGLFVIRPVDKYQPFKKTLAYRKRVNQEEYVSQRRSQPKGYKEAEEIKMVLTGEMLKSIRTSTSIINFGRLFINSVAKQPFFIINELMTSIQVRLETNHPSLELVDASKYIIGSSERGRFDISLKASELGQMKIPIKYFINQVHQFELLIFAEVQHVHLFANKSTIKMTFTDDNLTMFTTETIILRNDGNANAQFQINNIKKCILSPSSGIITERNEETITIRFRPPQTSIIQAGEPHSIKEFSRSATNVIDQRVVVTITHGVDLPLRIQANLPEPRCYIKQHQINFGNVIIHKQKIKTFYIKNVSKICAVFEINQDQLDQSIKVQPMFGKVQADGLIQLTVRFQSKKELQVKSKIVVNIRAGATIHLPVLAKVILPNVIIAQAAFNFGTLTVLTPGILPLTLFNRCQLPIQMVCDMSSPIYDGLQLEEGAEICLTEQSQNVTLVKKSKNRITKIDLEPESRRQFRLRFIPQNVYMYNFDLPLYMTGNYKSKSMTRVITCNAIEAMLVVEPNELKFDKKIIVDIEKSIPSIEILTIRNLHNREVVWKLGEDIRKVDIFSARPTQGVIAPDQDIKVRFLFNPIAKGVFHMRLPLNIYDETLQEFTKFTDVHLQGECDEPQIVFDKAELILPAVPLGVESKASFRIINEGYQHMDITYKLDAGIDTLINVTLHFPQGKKIGINKNQIPILATFTSKKPISFTAKLQFSDKAGKIYTLPVSGTSDNCYLSVYPYFSHDWATYTLKSTLSNLQLVENIRGNLMDTLLSFKLPEKHVYDYPRQFVQKWLRFMLNDQTIGNFPESIIDSKGACLIRLIQLLAGKKESDRMFVQNSEPLNFYENLLKQLKGLGCLLNNIRAYYLLDQKAYDLHLQSQISGKKAVNYKYWHVSYNSWIYLFYQIVSLFSMPVKTKQTMQINQRNKIKSSNIEKETLSSNLYSTYELSLLQWAQSIWDTYNQTPRKFNNFREIYCDGIALFYIVYHHIPLKEKLLDTVYKHATSRTEIETNIRKTLSMLSIIGAESFVDEEDFAKMNEKEFILYISQLHNMLPHFLPKETSLIFSCYLGDQLTKSLQIQNPSNKAVSYGVRIEGCSDYIVEEKYIKIEPHKTFSLKVTFRSRKSEPMKAFLMLTTKRDGTCFGSPMVFELTSQIVGRKSIKAFDPIHSKLYQSTNVRLNIQNKFDNCEYGEFQVMLIQERQSDKKTGRDTPSHKSKQHQRSFYCDVTRLKLKRMCSSVIQLSYLPLSLETVKCYIVFCDPNVGEFQYQIEGITEHPRPLMQTRSHLIMIDKHQSIEIPLPTQNSLMNKARLQAQKKYKQNFDGLSKNKSTPSQPTEFTISSNSPYEVTQFVEFPKTITLNIPRRNQSDEIDSTSSIVKLKVDMQFKALLKDACLDLILTNHNKTDVRRFKVCINVIPKPIKLAIEMVAPARSQVIQNIPITNNSDRDWRLKIQLPSDKPQFFVKLEKISKDVICKRGSQISLPLYFQPSWICRVESLLIITNVTTNQTIEYELVGLGEQPLSQTHINIKCRVSQMKIVPIPVINPFGTNHEFKVETDLVNCYGSSTIHLHAQKKCNYQLTINPLLSGSYTGAITFYDEQNRYFWYTLTIQTDGRPADTIIELITILFKSVEVDIEIFNPTNELAIYETDISGQDLFGNNQLLVQPKSSAMYKLAFCPKSIYEHKGRISFINQKLGEKCYEIRLCSQQSTPIKMPQIRCEIGTEKSFELKLPEHYRLDTIPDSIISNESFRIDKLVKKQNNSYLIGWYRPTLVGNQDICQITLSHSIFGSQIYLIDGTGELPTTINKIQVYAALNELVMKSITFQNPFSHPLSIYAQLIHDKIRDNGTNAFDLPNEYRERITLAPRQSTDIIFHFRPREILESSAQIHLCANERICWKYKLSGNVFMWKDDVSMSYSTVCRGELAKYIDILVHETQDMHGEAYDYNFLVEYPQKEFQGLLKNCLEIKLASSHLNCVPQCLRFHMTFKPVKPFKSYIDLYVKRSTGGVWKYRVFLESTKPPPEQTIIIETKHGKSASVSFLLPILAKTETKFTARIQLSQESQLFQVSPISGVLNTVDDDKPEQNNCRITISYAPITTFKNVCLCNLIVETEDSYWIYVLKGVVAMYRPPIVESRFKKMLSSDDKPCSPPCTIYKSKPLIGRNSSVESTQNKFIIRRA